MVPKSKGDADAEEEARKAHPQYQLSAFIDAFSRKVGTAEFSNLVDAFLTGLDEDDADAKAKKKMMGKKKKKKGKGVNVRSR